MAVVAARIAAAAAIEVRLVVIFTLHALKRGRRWVREVSRPNAALAGHHWGGGVTGFCSVSPAPVRQMGPGPARDTAIATGDFLPRHDPQCSKGGATVLSCISSCPHPSPPRTICCTRFS